MKEDRTFLLQLTMSRTNWVSRAITIIIICNENITYFLTFAISFFSTTIFSAFFELFDILDSVMEIAQYIPTHPLSHYNTTVIVILYSGNAYSCHPYRHLATGLSVRPFCSISCFIGTDFSFNVICSNKKKICLYIYVYEHN